MATTHSVATKRKPFASGLWIAFWFWSAIVALVWLPGTGVVDTWVETRLGGNPAEQVVGVQNGSQKAAAFLLTAVDPLWLILAAAVCYLATAAESGLAVTRRWSLFVFLGVIAAGAGCAWYGGLLYTTRLGPRLGPVPLGLPMLWCALLLGGRGALRSLFPRASHGQVALGVGLLAALTVWNLESVVGASRVWWLWRTGQIPWWQYVGWPMLALGLAWCLRGSGVRLSAAPSRRGLWVCLALNGLPLLVHLRRAFLPSLP